MKQSMLLNEVEACLDCDVAKTLSAKGRDSRGTDADDKAAEHGVAIGLSRRDPA
jgi:hypothetical protein